MLYATLSFAPAGVHSGAAGWTEQLNTLSGRDHMQERNVYLCAYRLYKLTILHGPYMTNPALFCIHAYTVYYVKCEIVHTCIHYIPHIPYRYHWTINGIKHMQYANADNIIQYTEVQLINRYTCYDLINKM